MTDKRKETIIKEILKSVKDELDSGELVESNVAYKFVTVCMCTM
jgi:hypothetical protein